MLLLTYAELSSTITHRHFVSPAPTIFLHQSSRLPLWLDAYIREIQAAWPSPPPTTSVAATAAQLGGPRTPTADVLLVGGLPRKCQRPLVSSSGHVTHSSLVGRPQWPHSWRPLHSALILLSTVCDGAVIGRDRPSTGCLALKVCCSWMNCAKARSSQRGRSRGRCSVSFHETLRCASSACLLVL